MDYQRQAAVRQMQCSSFLPNTVLLNQLTKLSFKFSDSLFSAISIIAVDRHAYAKKGWFVINCKSSGKKLRSTLKVTSTFSTTPASLMACPDLAPLLKSLQSKTSKWSMTKFIRCSRKETTRLQSAKELSAMQKRPTMIFGALKTAKSKSTGTAWSTSLIKKTGKIKKWILWHYHNSQ